VGALIVRGDREPTLKKNGDIDTLLKDENDKPMKDRILVLQQIQYYCPNSKNQWECDPKDTGVIESYDNFTPGTWSASGRYTSINGKIIPIFKAKQGEIERWRMIHGGLRDTISLQFRKLQVSKLIDTLPQDLNSLKAADTNRYISENCAGDPIPYHVIADDGLTRSQAWQTTLTTLQPGYRSDALVIFPKPGFYCVIDASVSGAASVSRKAESRRLLGMVVALPGKPVSDIPKYLKGQLVAAAERTMPEEVQGKVVSDLENGLKLSSFTPHPDIQDNEVTGNQELAFFIDVTRPPAVKYEVSNGLNDHFQPKPYDPNRIDRFLTLGDVDEWTLESYFASHPFHIHVNPFQIIKILDPNGKDVSLPDAIDNAGCPDPNAPDCKPDPEYPGLKGVWKDTLWIKSLVPPGTDLSKGVYTIVVRTRYQRYIGEFVIHCHILDHEDQGMMQNVSIVIPNGAGGSSGGHH
jgi:FtsP/CotA-like multicopper oxidase with cupredoxin domain